jgi:DNA-binding CsgD family transcriptional regulator
MAVYTRIAGHMAAAFRCRRRLGISLSPSVSDREPEHEEARVEAILDTNGNVVHAEGEAAERTARERIRSAAESMEAARTGRVLGKLALDAWRPLVGARWTLVASFAENGKRYLVARENQSREEGLGALTDREQQVVLQAMLGLTNKEIAYVLGISASTVRVLMARAATKLGVRSRSEVLSHPSLRAVRH